MASLSSWVYSPLRVLSSLLSHLSNLFFFWCENENEDNAETVSEYDERGIISAPASSEEASISAYAPRQFDRQPLISTPPPNPGRYHPRVYETRESWCYQTFRPGVTTAEIIAAQASRTPSCGLPEDDDLGFFLENEG